MVELPNHGPIGELEVTEWIGTPPAPTLGDLRGRVILIEAFQMLCPGCVSHGLPQAARIHRAFGDEMAVIGLHTVFEHHDVMTPAALRVFLSEYRIPFPVAVDKPRGTDLPATMSRLGLQGTPTLLLVDKQGDLRLRAFGQADDLLLGSVIGRLLAE